jgi:hypothetical protein
MRQPDRAEITADFLVQDAGPGAVQRTWPDGADFAGDCPVCGRSEALTGPWRQATEGEVVRLGDEARAGEAAELAGARGQAPGGGSAAASAAGAVRGAAHGGWIRVRPGAAWLSWAAPPDAGGASAAAGLRAVR